jgi:hypothetical protein
MVPLKTPDILDCLRAIAEVRSAKTSLHLLGVTRVGTMTEFATLGVDSFDSTSPFRQAFMDDKKNYHTADGAYVAIRVPQVDGNASLKRRILSGQVSQKVAVRMERDCLKSLRAFDSGEVQVEDVLDALARYQEVIDPEKRSYLDDYRRTLEDAPWKSCPCQICQACSIDVAIFRGTERNKRRGFHNLSVFGKSVRDLPAKRRGPATRKKSDA